MFGIVSIFAFSACGKGLPKLTPEQKVTLKDTLSGLGEAFQVPAEARKAAATAPRSHPSTHTPPPSPGYNPPSSSSSLSSEREAARKSMTDKLQQSISRGECKDKAQITKDSHLNDNVPHMHLGGSKCPILMNIHLESVGKKTITHLDYKVQDPEYSTFNDVDAVTFDYTTHLEKTSRPAGSTDLKGKLHAQKNGDVTVSGHWANTDRRSNWTLRFEFATFTVGLESLTDSKGTQYFLNDEEVPEKEMKEYLNGNTFFDLGGSAALQ